MAVKLFGSLCIMVGIMGIGSALAFKEKFRLESLMALRKNINMLISELHYNREMFYEAIKKLSEGSDEMKKVYDEILKGLDNNNSAYLSWKFAFEKFKQDLYLNRDELERIWDLGNIFSSADYNYQKSEMDSMLLYLDNKIKLSGEKFQKDIRLYRSISISAAAFVIILLF